MTRPHTIDTLAQLEALFGQPGEASLRKEVDFLHPHYQALIAASPFAVLATCNTGHLDTSPRGDPPGFVAVQDEKTLLLPERRGNHRIDSLRNIVADPRVALLFLVPGVGETLRVNGKACITVAPELLARFAVEGKPPQCVLVIQVESVYFQCARAIQRSKLWAPVPADAPRTVPTPGAILAAPTAGEFDGATYDRELPQRQKNTLY
ncbi:pyridoxamine 5'-phosphate oxidase [Variovorax sp. WS11]|uniref:pyridoxamine 5'-phosphate oxidase family protein n=1 Tax=Variovorax sp. WS11 TaxID=1105204 RepID=UPI000D0D243D|nr:pyridoxamine 5'-phosphate oxidase family protein [Variovorax sp. WS11]NDZ15491.1 pyridoxamine 5'-phosphate oxidase family protein [Variovorax sp. WS11]PSL84845.1 pyridoxamine 5'-phosphate oxidase [Variovorax sp. WS11]